MAQSDAATPPEEAMPIRSRLRVQLNRRNLTRAEQGEAVLTAAELARQTGISYGTILDLINNRTTRIDFETLDRLMQYFGTNDLDDILEYRPPDQRQG